MLSTEKIIEILHRGGYPLAAKLIENAESSISRKAEFDFLCQCVTEDCFDEEICRDHLRMLWTAYCLHHGLNVDTFGYDNDLLTLWNKMEEVGDGTSEWSGFEDFDNFMCKYLV